MKVRFQIAAAAIIPLISWAGHARGMPEATGTCACSAVVDGRILMQTWETAFRRPPAPGMNAETVCRSKANDVLCEARCRLFSLRTRVERFVHEPKFWDTRARMNALGRARLSAFLRQMMPKNVRVIRGALNNGLVYELAVQGGPRIGVPVGDWYQWLQLHVRKPTQKPDPAIRGKSRWTCRGPNGTCPSAEEVPVREFTFRPEHIAPLFRFDRGNLPGAVLSYPAGIRDYFNGIDTRAAVPALLTAVAGTAARVFLTRGALSASAAYSIGLPWGLSPGDGGTACEFFPTAIPKEAFCSGVPGEAWCGDPERFAEYSSEYNRFQDLTRREGLASFTEEALDRSEDVRVALVLDDPEEIRFSLPRYLAAADIGHQIAQGEDGPETPRRTALRCLFGERADRCRGLPAKWRGLEEVSFAHLRPNVEARVPGSLPDFFALSRTW